MDHTACNKLLLIAFLKFGLFMDITAMPAKESIINVATLSVKTSVRGSNTTAYNYYLLQSLYLANDTRSKFTFGVPKRKP